MPRQYDFEQKKSGGITVPDQKKQPVRCADCGKEAVGSLRELRDAGWQWVVETVGWSLHCPEHARPA